MQYFDMFMQVLHVPRLLLVLREIALAQAISPIATHFFVAWSVVCLSSVTLVHHKPFGVFTSGFTLAGSGSSDIVLDGVPHSQGKSAILWIKPPIQKLHLPACDSPVGSTYQLFRLLRNYF